MFPFFESNNKKFNCFLSSPLIYPMHFHVEVEFLYLISGFVDISIDKIPYRMHAGDFAVIFPGQLHEYRYQSDHGLNLLALFQPDFTPEFASVLRETYPRTPVISSEQCHPDIASSMKQLLNELHAEAPNTLVYPAYLQLILSHSMPLLHPAKKQEKHDESLLFQVVEFLTANFQKPLTLEAVADVCGVSKYHLSRVFSQQMHTSFPVYLNTLRINDAQIKLQTTQFSITDIAYLCGFDSPRSFNRNFIRLTGMTPREYRRQHKNSP